MAIPSIDDLDVAGKRVLLRVDINSPIDPATGAITDENRIDQSLATIRDLAERKARLVIIAHQGDTLDYHNLVGLGQHAVRLAAKLGRPVGFVDDVAGPAARDRIAALGDRKSSSSTTSPSPRRVSTFGTMPARASRWHPYPVRNLAPVSTSTSTTPSPPPRASPR
jgi:phosphoglycerate kinase